MTGSVAFFYWAPLLSFAAALAILKWLLMGGFAQIAMDHPNQRSLHSTPVPRTGGLGLMSGVLIAWAFTTPGPPPILWAGVGLVLTISFLDDLRGVPIVWRFLGHFMAAGVVGIPVLLDQSGLLVTSLAIVATVWMTNLYNFMDGSDGLAGGMGLFGFGFYGLAAWLAGDEAFAMVNFSISTASAAFLLFNFHPARIFMGDAGSIPLGFLAATLGMIGWRQGDWPVWFPLLVFSCFIADASVTLIKRGLHGKKVWRAHREHYYQRLVQIGWGHRGTALFEYGLMAAAGICAIWVIRQDAPTQTWVGASWIIFYFIVMAGFDRYWRNRSGSGRNAHQN